MSDNTAEEMIAEMLAAADLLPKVTRIEVRTDDMRAFARAANAAIQTKHPAYPIDLYGIPVIVDAAMPRGTAWLVQDGKIVAKVGYAPDGEP